MKRLIRCLVLAALLLGLLPAAALAEGEHFTGADNWKVTFTSDKQMVSSFSKGDLDDKISGMQPGDDITLSVKLQNSYKDPTDWYLSNKVARTLEETSAAGASGGAYTYRLTYIGPDGASSVIYDSDTVGGDTQDGSKQGLGEATNAMEDYFFLGTIGSGKSGEVQLYIALDGETQGNAYMNTLADLEMSFAVDVNEPTAEPKKETVYRRNTTTVPTTSSTVSTGDSTDLRPLFIAMSASGLVLLALGVDGLRRRSAEKKEA